MALPDYQTLMRPVLAIHEDGADHPRGDVRARLIDEFQLSDDDLQELLPSGTQRAFHNRVNWSTFYLVKAGLLTRPRRGSTVITERGREALQANTDRIDNHVLDQYPEFLRFRLGGRPPETGAEGPPTAEEDATPVERIEAAHDELNAALAEELLERVRAQDDVFVEYTVLDVLVRMGYGGSRREAAQRVGRSGDGGVDGLIREDRLGLDVIYVQAKKWAEDHQVGPRQIREFMGALQDAGATKGVFATESPVVVAAEAAESEHATHPPHLLRTPRSALAEPNRAEPIRSPP